jgi:hypothetical protein
MELELYEGQFFEKKLKMALASLKNLGQKT